MEGKLGKPRKAAPGLRNKQPVVSVIIVNYHVEKELFACLTSLKQNTSAPLFEIIIVDNDEKKTLEKPLKTRFPDVLYLPSPGNIGFGAGNNLGVSRAKGELLFFLNPDTKVSKNTIQELSQFLKEHSNVAIVAPILVDIHNKPFLLQGTTALTPFTALFAHSFLNKLFPQNPVSKKFWLKDWDKKSDKKVDTAPGTAFMIRNEFFREIGGFDEKLFLYFEEDDLGRRVTNLGKDIYITSKTSIFHAIGKSMEKSKTNT
ncbi:MAG: glycosyltransferase family 2 protein, partial [Patescibacteria group bacterium]|nr:glycosyltransferase family 2 protein [Patescibacteria group bacterium]